MVCKKCHSDPCICDIDDLEYNTECTTESEDVCPVCHSDPCVCDSEKLCEDDGYIDFPRAYNDIVAASDALQKMASAASGKSAKLLRKAAYTIRMTIEELNDDLEDSGYFDYEY